MVCECVRTAINYVMDFESKSITNDWNLCNLHEALFDHFSFVDFPVSFERLICSLQIERENIEIAQPLVKLCGPFR